MSQRRPSQVPRPAPPAGRPLLLANSGTGFASRGPVARVTDDGDTKSSTVAELSLSTGQLPLSDFHACVKQPGVFVERIRVGHPGDEVSHDPGPGAGIGRGLNCIAPAARHVGRLEVAVGQGSDYGLAPAYGRHHRLAAIYPLEQ